MARFILVPDLVKRFRGKGNRNREILRSFVKNGIAAKLLRFGYQAPMTIVLNGLLVDLSVEQLSQKRQPQKESG
jgi:hypothetical protein